MTRKPPNHPSPAKIPPPPWSLPIAATDIPESGRHIELIADDGVRDAIVQMEGLVALPRLGAQFDLMRYGSDGLRLVGRVMATVVQSCVVTLEPIESRIDEAVDLTFVPGPLPEPDPDELQPIEADPPEVMHDGLVDVGTVATEFLLLGIDPYPRKPGSVFDAPPAGDPISHPFAALAALKKVEKPKPD